VPKQLEDLMQDHLRLHFGSKGMEDREVLAVYPAATQRNILRHLYLEVLHSCSLLQVNYGYLLSQATASSDRPGSSAAKRPAVHQPACLLQLQAALAKAMPVLPSLCACWPATSSCCQSPDRFRAQLIRAAQPPRAHFNWRLCLTTTHHTVLLHSGLPLQVHERAAGVPTL
jgi:hypothetical protein